MDRIAGIETEYGCLVSSEAAHANGDAWPVRAKNHLFRKMHAGAIDLHYRDYEEPPGNGGFLRNGGRIYLDMGHIEYASPECRQLRDMVAYDLAGDQLLQSALDSLGGAEHVSEIIYGDEEDITARSGGESPAEKKTNERQDQNVFHGGATG